MRRRPAGQAGDWPVLTEAVVGLLVENGPGPMRGDADYNEPDVRTFRDDVAREADRIARGDRQPLPQAAEAVMRVRLAVTT